MNKVSRILILLSIIVIVIVIFINKWNIYEGNQSLNDNRGHSSGGAHTPPHSPPTQPPTTPLPPNTSISNQAQTTQNNIISGTSLLNVVKTFNF
jgi:hypothetical protein